MLRISSRIHSIVIVLAEKSLAVLLAVSMCLSESCVSFDLFQDPAHLASDVVPLEGLWIPSRF